MEKENNTYKPIKKNLFNCESECYSVTTINTVSDVVRNFKFNKLPDVFVWAIANSIFISCHASGGILTV